MSETWNRRELLTSMGQATAALTAAGLAVSSVAQARTAPAAPPKPTAGSRKLRAPYAVGSGNCLSSKRADGTSVLAECLARLARGERTVAAVVAGVEICELDPEDTSVGYGGLPNADGVVQLDAAVMECPRGSASRAGAVAALEGIRTPARVALAVADQTDHHLLVGAGAQLFARQTGHAIEADLNTERSRAAWLEWRRRIDPTHWLDPERRSEALDRAREELVAAGWIDPHHVQGTIHLSAMGRSGDVACVTTTSGLAFKLPGRVGDSPILGAGLYCAAEVGSAGSTGRGEANLANLSSAWIVEEMRRGAHPKDAALAALARVRDGNGAARLRDASGRPTFNLQFYVLDAKGQFAGVSLYRDYKGSIARFAVGDESGVESVESEALLERYSATES